MEISAVKLRNSYQINYVNTNNLFVNQNALCVVETEHGVDIGNVYKCHKHRERGGQGQTPAPDHPGRPEAGTGDRGDREERVREMPGKVEGEEPRHEAHLGEVPVRPHEDHLLLRGGEPHRLPRAGARARLDFQDTDRDAADRRAGTRRASSAGTGPAASSSAACTRARSSSPCRSRWRRSRT